MEAVKAEIESEMLWREAARRDPSRFMEYAMRDEHGEPLRQGAVHRDLQRHFSRPELLVGAEVPREHGKSVQIAVGRAGWEIGRNPHIRAKIICATDQLASARGAAVRRLVESQEFRNVFPGVVPGDKWGEARFSVKRDTNLVDPTLECFGVSGGQTGGRADLLIFDDVVDVEAVRSDSARRLVEERVENVWLNLRSPKGRAWWIATPWHCSDYTAKIRDKWTWMRRPVGPNAEPVWPERWPSEALRARRDEIGDIAYARGFLLQPVGDGVTVIKPETIRFWALQDELPADGAGFMGVDPAISEKTSADFSVICEAVYKAPRLYVVGLHRGQWGGPQLKASIRARAEAFHPREMAVESVAFQKLLVDDLLETHPYPIRPVAPGGDPIGNDKRSRAEWLAIQFANGNILLRGQPGTGLVHPSQASLFDELTGFPVAEHDDTMDALFYAARAAMKVGRVRVGW